MRSRGLPVPHLTDEVLLGEVARVAELVGKPVLTREDFDKHSRLVYSGTLTRRYGSWQTVLERAGVGRMYTGLVEKKLWFEGRKWYSEEVLIKEVRRVARLVDTPTLTKSDFTKRSKMNAYTLRRRFGNWQTALERAGLSHMYAGPTEERPYPIVHPRHSDKALLAEIRRVAGLGNRKVMTGDDFDKHSRVGCAHTIARRFGGWRAALDRAGVGHVGVPPRTRQSDETLLAEVRRVSELVDQPVLSVSGFSKHSRYSARTLYRRFGKWRTVLERAGVGHMYAGTAPSATARERVPHQPPTVIRTRGGG